jgi:MYXO-CTERM domain-containing protein
MRKTTAALGLAAALSLTPVVATPAEAHGRAARPAVVAETPAPEHDNYNSSGNKGLWGLLGLVGLLGLIPRRRKPQQPAQRPHASDTTRTTSGSQEYEGDLSRNPRR